MNAVKELNSNYSKLFYLITSLSKAKVLTKQERVKLKGKNYWHNLEMTIQDDKDIMNIIEQYNSSGDDQELKQAIINLAKGENSASSAENKEQNQHAEDTKGIFDI